MVDDPPYLGTPPPADPTSPADAAQAARPAEIRLAKMLEARSIAVVGASERPGSFGLRMTREALRSPSSPTVHLVHPSRRTVLGRPCLPSLADVPAQVDLVLLGVPDYALVSQLTVAAERGDAGAVVFGPAAGMGRELSDAAGNLALCGASCMGFVNVARGVRAIGYVERHPLPSGGIALVTHSGSVFSTLLRTHRRLEFCLVVSSGQELMTTTADYLSYALSLPETRVIGLFLETVRDVPRFREVLSRAAQRDIPVVALTVGGSSSGRSLVEAHSGALAGDDAGWEALFAAHGVHRTFGLDEFVDTLEVVSIGRRICESAAGRGIATVHDSGAERVLVADAAQRLGSSFADISVATKDRLGTLLGAGLRPMNPLDVWSTGAGTAPLFTECMAALADDDAVGVVALAVDLAPEYDGDEAYPEAVEAVLKRTEKPIVVLANLASAVDQITAARLRAQGVPVLEGTQSGLRALAHLLSPRPSPPVPATVDQGRQARWRVRLAAGRLDQAASMRLLEEYGVATVAAQSASSRAAAVEIASRLGYPVVLKTDDPAIPHKVDVGGVVLGLGDARAVRAAYDDIASRLGPEVTIQRQMPAGVELYVGLVRDALVGPLVLVGMGGTLVELVGQRRVSLPPLDADTVRAMLEQLVGEVSPATADIELPDVGAVVPDVLAVSQIAVELGDVIEALDVNPLIVSADGAVAVDALIVRGQGLEVTDRRSGSDGWSPEVTDGRSGSDGWSVRK